MAAKTNKKRHSAVNRQYHGAKPKAPAAPRAPPPPPFTLRDKDTTVKLLEVILESPGGKRSLSRLARTCRALCEPALNLLWRDLDSLVPIMGLFPGHLWKKAHRPGLGLAKVPLDEDWGTILHYSERVRRIAYDENAGNVAASIFSIFDECRPRPYLLPRLVELTWKAETPAGLDRCTLFLNPELQILNLEVGSKFPELDTFLEDVCNRTKLTTFSFASPTILPENFTTVFQHQTLLEKLILAAPGALSPTVGHWSAWLKRLTSLQLDLTGRSSIAVDGFFGNVHLGPPAPSSVASRDSGIFSGEELDLSEVRKSVLRTPNISPVRGPFAHMRRLQLTGNVSNIAAFLRQLSCPLTQLDLIIEDPPEQADWRDLCGIISKQLGESLQSLRVSATGSSRFAELVRSTSRAEAPLCYLPLQSLTSLSCLTRLEIDLPESIIFTPADIESVAVACPNLEILRLCPLARFATPPKITLDSLVPLIRKCQRLHTIAAVIDAQPGNSSVFASQYTSSRSLLRLHLGHSWIGDPLQISILLSHLAPHLEILKWFQDKNRPGFNEANAKAWQQVSELLPHLQTIRLIERRKARQPIPVIPPARTDKGVDATVKTTSRSVHAAPQTTTQAIQFSPALINRLVQARPDLFSVSIDATPLVTHTGVNVSTSVAHMGVEARPSTTSISIEARPLTVDTAVEAKVLTVSQSIEACPSPITPSLKSEKGSKRRATHTLLFFPSILHFFSVAYRILISYPLSIPSQILNLTLARFHPKRESPADTIEKENSTASSPISKTDIALETLQVRQ
ncbi:hypothetical protein BD779DRAFT_1431974 [Infundibulicybe gibba]|nr:hypothetical protein BD779DRAFT_1431974 [Infundibulicybe gibba]